jgi:Ca-activated chloride channel family protein
MHWADARFLHGLWALLPLAWMLWLLIRRRERKLGLLLDGEASARLAPERSRARVWAKALLWLLACALAILALARPQWGSRWQEVRRRGLDILVVLDTSNSMRAADLKPDRLQRAKWGIADLLGKLSGDRIGLVAFAGSSFLACPLTVDYAAFSMMLDDVRPGIIPRGGTAIAQALQTALEGFEGKGDADRVIVLITDGEDHEGGIDQAIARLRERKVRVFAVGVGATAGEAIPAAGGAGDAFLRDRSGNVVRTALKEEVLEKLAFATGGQYVRATADDFGLERAYSQGMANLQRDERESKLTRVYVERFPWFLAAAALLLVLESLLGERRRETPGDVR